VEAEHKELVKEYKTFQGVVQATKDIILESVDNEYLLEIEDEILGFLHQTPTNMLIHLRNWKLRRSLGLCGHKKAVGRERWRMGRK
jgi:hypothetical protein